MQSSETEDKAFPLVTQGNVVLFHPVSVALSRFSCSRVRMRIRCPESEEGSPTHPAPEAAAGEAASCVQHGDRKVNIPPFFHHWPAASRGRERNRGRLC